jgi:hypothetical protein
MKATIILQFIYIFHFHSETPRPAAVSKEEKLVEGREI